MLKANKEGYTIWVKLPEECGYKGYSVKCVYRYVKQEEKYALSMWLVKDDMKDNLQVEDQEIDMQYLSGTKENIERKIWEKIVQASLSGYFDYYIEKYRYTYQCLSAGNDLYEGEMPVYKKGCV